MKKLLALFSLTLVCILNSSFLTAGFRDLPAGETYYEYVEERDPSKAGMFDPSEFEGFSWEEEEPAETSKETVIDPSKAGMFEESQFQFGDDDDIDEDWTFID